MNKFYSVIYFSFLFLFFNNLAAQLLPPLQPEQDCINALSVCQDIFIQTNSYQGEGRSPNEINPIISCLGSGERNDVWYIFTVQLGGNLSFSITPFAGFDDYDWALYDLTTASCTDIRTNAALEVSCNYAPNLGCGGVTGANGNTLGPCGGQNEVIVPVLLAQTYVLNVSNFSSTASGYTLDFTASTAVIFDTIPPRLDSLSVACGDTVIHANFSENILCATVDPTDFAIIGPGGPYTVTAVTGPNCAINGRFESQFEISVSPVINTSGMYYLSLIDTVTDNCGNVAIYRTDSIWVSTDSVLAYITEDSVCSGDAVTLSTNLQSSQDHTFLWTPGNITTPGFTANPNMSTQYVITATDINSACITHDTVDLIVMGSPLVDFSIADVCFGDSSRFIDLTIASVLNPITKWEWSLGVTNGNASSSDPVYLYGLRGNYTTKLIVTTVFGCTDSATHTANVHDLPLANFRYTPACEQTEAVVFQNKTGFLDGPLTWLWSFGDGNNNMTESPSHIYTHFDTFTVSLTASNVHGCKTTFTEKVEVYPRPRVDFLANSVCFNTPTDFLNETTIPSGYTVDHYYWTLGDGDKSEEVSFSRKYLRNDTFWVILEAVSAHGCRDTISHKIAVWPNPTADFEAESICVNEPVFFTDKSTIDGKITNDILSIWKYNFDDGNFSNSQNPQHIYSIGKTYQVELVSTSDKGCADTIIKPLIIWPAPKILAAFNDTVCPGLPVRVEVLVDGETKGINWYLTSNATERFRYDDFLYFESLPKSQTFYAEPISDFGCLGTRVPVSVKVQPEFVGSIISDSIKVELPNSQIQFWTSGNLGIRDYLWHFGDGDTSDLDAPYHLYTRSNVFDVLLNFIDMNGCAGELLHTITVQKVATAVMPNAFSPNGDGYNDFFYMPHINLSSFSMQIYSRWGELVYTTDDPNFRWDGKDLSGKDVPEGIYVYKFVAVDIENEKIEDAGTLTLFR